MSNAISVEEVVSTQAVLQIFLGMITMGIGWMLNTLWNAHRDLSERHNEHVTKVAEHYVTKNDFREELDHIRKTCDNIWKTLREGGK